MPLPKVSTLSSVIGKRELFRQLAAHVEEVLQIVGDDCDLLADSPKEQELIGLPVRPASLENDPWSLVAMTVITVILLWAGWLADRGRLRVLGLHAWQWVAASMPLIAMAYLAVRNVPVAAIWLAPVITLLGSAIARSGLSMGFRRLWLLASTAALVAALLAALAVIERPRPEIAIGGQVLGSTHPCQAVAFMRVNRLRGNVYTPLWWGSYVTWELYPSILVSMDGRNISLFPDDMVAKNLLFYSPEARRTDLDVALEYAADYLLVPADRVVLAMVRADSRWRPMYADRDAALFVRADAAHGAELEDIDRAGFVVPSEPCPQVLAPEEPSAPPSS